MAVSWKRRKRMEKQDDVRTYDLPFAPLSHNQAYSQRRTRKGFAIRFLRNEYRAFKEEVKKRLEQQDEKRGSLPFDPPFDLHFIFTYESSSFFYKNGKPRRFDVSDCVKLLEDAFVSFTGVDDCHHFRLTAEKRWVPDGELSGFEEEPYNHPPTKLIGTIRIEVRKWRMER